MNKKIILKLLLFLSLIGKAQYTKLLDFSGSNGKNPYGSLIYDGTYLYGMTYMGGTNDSGVIFKIKPDGTGDTVLFNFNSNSGAAPTGDLLLNGSFLYGMTQTGGQNNNGTIFKIKTDGTGFLKLSTF